MLPSRITDQTHPTHPPGPTGPPHPRHAIYATDHPYATCIAIVAAVAACAVGIHWGTWAAGGSDSSCYLNETRLLSHGTVQIEQPLILAATWPRADWTFTPAGFRPSPVHEDRIVPICSPGLPLLMAAAQVFRISPMLVVPLCGALAVWTAFLLARRLGGAVAGAAAAVLLACSPIFLFQVVQPMTDVPVAAWWLLVLVLAGNERDAAPRPLAAGMAAGIATLIRPNLLPVAVIAVVHIGLTARIAWRGAVVRFLVGLIPGLVVLALFQRAAYGSSVASGYGSTADLFATVNVLPNLARYGRWLYETHTPLLALGVIAPLVLPRRETWTFLLITAATVAAYLPYQQFDAWWYLRFVILAIALLIVLSTAVISSLAARVTPRHHAAVLLLVVTAIALAWVRVARERSAFELQALERPFIDAGTFVAQRLPDRAAIVALRYTGSVAYHAGRPTIAWDALDSNALEPALTFLRAHDYAPFLVVDASEEADFRSRFGSASETGRLDWPPLARVGRTIRVYDPADRARYLAGAQVHTIDVPSDATFHRP
jgi:dolichyl-phosphate-mannose-protein mannosyltransferase